MFETVETIVDQVEDGSVSGAGVVGLSTQLYRIEKSYLNFYTRIDNKVKYR